MADFEPIRELDIFPLEKANDPWPEEGVKKAEETIKFPLEGEKTPSTEPKTVELQWVENPSLRREYQAKSVRDAKVDSHPSWQPADKPITIRILELKDGQRGLQVFEETPGTNMNKSIITTTLPDRESALLAAQQIADLYVNSGSPREFWMAKWDRDKKEWATQKPTQDWEWGETKSSGAELITPVQVPEWDKKVEATRSGAKIISTNSGYKLFVYQYDSSDNVIAKRELISLGRGARGPHRTSRWYAELALEAYQTSASETELK